MHSFSLGGCVLPKALCHIAHAACEQNALTPDQLDCKWEAWALSNAKSTGVPTEKELSAFVAHLRQKALHVASSKPVSKSKLTPKRSPQSLLHSPTPTPTRINRTDDFFDVDLFNYCDEGVKEEVLVKDELVKDEPLVTHNDEPVIVRDLSDVLEQSVTQSKRTRVLKDEPLPGDDLLDNEYAKRTGTGRVEASLDNSQATPHNPMSVHVRGAVSVQSLSAVDRERTKYMNNLVRQRINDVRSHMQTVTEHILKRVKLLRAEHMPPLSSANLLDHSPATVLIAGRIRTELEETDASSKGSVNIQSVVLENEDGNRIKLNLNRFVENKHPLFINPGMIVVVEGVNTNGRLFDVHAIYDNAMQTPDQQRRVPNDEHQAKMEHDDEIQPSTSADQDAQPYANLVVAAGPFTRPSNLKYEPLTDLLQIIERNKPDVVILTGPFVDESHQHISDQTPMPFGQLFASRVISPLQATISRMADSGDTVPQFVLIPALEDVHHDFVCPQPAFCWPYKQQDPNIHLHPNPSVIRVSAKDGQHVSFVGTSSLPTLLDISADSVCMNKQDRLGSIVSHMLRQRSFYPTFPPSNSVPLDTNFLDRLGIMDVDTGDTVDMIIVPSKLKAFAKSVDGGAIAVNPGLASRESNGGTYAEIALPLHDLRQRRPTQANEDKIEVRVIRL